MPSGGTALTLIKGAMRMIGALATSEVLGPDEANDNLGMLNDLIESMSTQTLAVYGNDNSVYTLSAGLGTYTIGATAVSPNFIGPRPVRIDGAFVTFGGVDYPLDMIGPDDYNELPLKTLQGAFPTRMLYINDNPLGIIKVWPNPSINMPIAIDDNRVLTQVSALTTPLFFPPGYWLYMRAALAILLCPEYGQEPSANLIGIATSGLANLKRANKIKRRARFDPYLGGGPPPTYQTG